MLPDVNNRFSMQIAGEGVSLVDDEC